MLKTPVIVLNVKTYAEATGKSALDIARTMDKLSEENGVNMAISVQSTDIRMCKNECKLPIFAQNIDPIRPGSHTGWTLPEAVKSAGAIGTLINHSEHRLKLADIDIVLNRAKELDLYNIICSNNISTSKAIAALKPNFVAVEPPLCAISIPVFMQNPSACDL